jgi:hypothetical protein
MILSQSWLSVAVRADNAFADSAAATSNTIFPRLWPADLFRLEAEIA